MERIELDPARASLGPNGALVWGFELECGADLVIAMRPAARPARRYLVQLQERGAEEGEPSPWPCRYAASPHVAIGFGHWLAGQAEELTCRKAANGWRVDADGWFFRPVPDYGAAMKLSQQLRGGGLGFISDPNERRGWRVYTRSQELADKLDRGEPLP